MYTWTFKLSQLYNRFSSVSSFLSRVSKLTRDIDVGILSICPSVRLSVRPWRSDIRWKRLNILS